MLNVVTGGAGFLGSHLVNALVDDGEQVIIVDDLSTGHVRNLEHALSSGRATFVYANVAVGARELLKVVGEATKRDVGRIFHLASPASPNAYGDDPWAALAVNGLGTMSLVEVALRHGARLMFASTSEVYGDPLVHPQDETYFGNTDPIGPRSAYAEGKRFGEAVVAAAVRSRRLKGRIVRLFNCYGPGMAERDGRLVPALIAALMDGRPMPLHGSGRQTRCLTYVTDAVEGMRLVMDADFPELTPFNVGSDDERAVEDIARALSMAVGLEFSATYLPSRSDEPRRRRPDITRARALGWFPSTSLETGLRATFHWFREARLVFA